jgi:hypothetical protein
MKSSAEVLAYIDNYYMCMIQRPTMYASSPGAFEDIILVLERLRGFVLSDANQESAFLNYTLDLGFGARHISRDAGIPDTASDDEVLRFQRIADILRRFLVSQGRIPAGGGNADKSQ